MQKICQRTMPLLWGVTHAALTLLLSRWLIRGLAALFGWIGGLAGLDAEALSYGMQILAQFHTAEIVSPWLPALLIGAAVSTLTTLLPRPRRKHPVLRICLLIVLLLPLTLFALWFTQINDVRLGALLSVLLPMLPHLL